MRHGTTYVPSVSLCKSAPSGTQDECWEDDGKVAIWGIGKMEEYCSNNDHSLSKQEDPLRFDDSRQWSRESHDNYEKSTWKPADTNTLIKNIEVNLEQRDQHV